MEQIGLEEYFKSFRVKTALKLVLAGTVCLLINNIFHLDLVYFAALFCFLILILYHGQAFKAGVHSFIAAVVSGFVSILISYVLVESKAAYLVVMSVWIFLVIALLYKYFLSMLIGGVSATMIMYNAIYNTVTETPTILWDYLIQLAISIIVSAIIDDLVWPHRTRPAFQLTFKTVFQDFTDLFKNYAQDELSKKKDHSYKSVSLMTFSNMTNYVNRIQNEEGKDYPFDMYVKIIAYSRGIFIKTILLEELILAERDFMKDDRAREQVNLIFKMLSSRFSAIAEVVATKKIINADFSDIHDEICKLHDIYKEMHEIEGRENEYYDDLHAFGGMMPILDDIKANLIKITESINVIHKGDYNEIIKKRVSHAPMRAAKTPVSFFKMDSDAIKAGIKTVVIFLVLMYGESVLGLPGGNQVVFFAIVFGVIPNLGQAYMKSRYGVLGVFSGLLYSFLSLTVLFIAPHFAIVILLYMLGTFMAGFVASSSKDYAVAGLQAGLLFPFGILLTTGPYVDIDNAITRFLALLSAVFIGLIVQHLMWPVNPYKVLRAKISKSISLSGEIFTKIVTTEVNQKEEVENSVSPLAAALPTSTSLLHDAEYILRENEIHTEDIMNIIESIELTYADLETLIRTVFYDRYSAAVEDHRKDMKSNNDKVIEIFSKVSDQFKSKQDYTSDIRALRINIDNEVTRYRLSGDWKKYDPKGIEKIVLLNNSLDSLLELLYKISTCINNINGKEDTKEAEFKTPETVS